MSLFYFAYGSNLNPYRMMKRGVYYSSSKFGILLGWRLEFNKRSATGKNSFANIVPDEDGKVEGKLYRINSKGLKRLDLFEGYPQHYFRVKLPVLASHGKLIDAEVYIAHESQICNSLQPSSEYLNHILNGGKYVLSEGYKKRIKKIANS